MTVDGERVVRALEWADKVTAAGSGLSAITVRATVVELAQLVRDLTNDRTAVITDADLLGLVIERRILELDDSNNGYRAVED